MKKILTLFLLLSPSFLLARPSGKEQLQRAKQDIAMLEEEVIRLNNQKRSLNKIEHAMNDLEHEMKKYKKGKKDGFFVSWIYRPLVFIASICTIVLTVAVIYLYISPYNALTKWGMSEEHIQNDLGFNRPRRNNNRPRRNRNPFGNVQNLFSNQSNRNREETGLRFNPTNSKIEQSNTTEYNFDDDSDD